MNTALSAKVVALGAAGSMIAQQASWGLQQLWDSLPEFEIVWPDFKVKGATEPVAAVLEPVATAVVEAAAVVVEETAKVSTKASEEVTAAFADLVSREKHAVAAFGLGVVTAGAAFYGYSKLRANYPRKGGCWVSGGRNPETRVEGSEERNTLEPPFAVRVAFRNKRGEYTMTGWGYRGDYNNKTYLITAQHCLSSEVSEIYLRKGDKFFPVSIDQYEILGNDAVLIPVPENVFSKLCVRKPKYGIVPAMGQAVSVLGLEGRGTTGLLENEKGRGSFGRVIYRGTTLGGYSGSPYYSGNVIYGMHTNGGHYNGGYNAMYLHVKAKIITDEPDEPQESPRLLDEWFDESEEENFNVEWEGDWAVVQHQSGKYVRIRKEAYYAAEARWLDRDERRARQDLEDQNLRREEYEREFESSRVEVQPPPPQPQAVTVTIPTVAPSAPTSTASGNGVLPGTSRGGVVSAEQKPSEPENRQKSTPVSLKPSATFSRPEIENLKKLISTLESTGFQTDQKPSTKPSKPTHRGGRKH